MSHARTHLPSGTLRSADALEAGVAARLCNVSVHMGASAALQDISLEVRSGEWLALFGPSGCGKSVLLNVLHGSVRPDAGEATALNSFLIPSELAKAPRRPVKEWLAGRLSRHGVPQTRRAGRIAAALEMMGLDGLARAPADELTQSQRVLCELALALVAEPALLLLDNVMAGLPEPAAELVRARLNDRRAAEGMVVVEATGVARCAECSERVAVMGAGRILVCDGTADLLRRYAPDTVTVEAADPSSVLKTLHGIFDIIATETAEGLRFEAASGPEAAASLFRHAYGGVRVVHVVRGSLWDVFQRLSEGRPTQL